MRGRVCAAAVVVLLAAGCSSGSDSSSTATTDSAVVVASTAGAVPLPPEAHRSAAFVEGEPEQFLMDMSRSELDTWLDDHLPIGADWQGWKWCSETSGPTPDGSYWRTYAKPPDFVQSLLVASSTEPGGTSGLVISVQADDAGPC